MSRMQRRNHGIRRARALVRPQGVSWHNATLHANGPPYLCFGEGMGENELFSTGVVFVPRTERAGVADAMIEAEKCV